MEINTSGEKRRLKQMRRLEELEQDWKFDSAKWSVRRTAIAKYTRIPQLVPKSQFYGKLGDKSELLQMAKKLQLEYEGLYK
jgi:hypothetical protein